MGLLTDPVGDSSRIPTLAWAPLQCPGKQGILSCCYGIWFVCVGLGGARPTLGEEMGESQTAVG